MNRVFNAAQKLGAQTRRAFSTFSMDTADNASSRKWVAALAASGVVVGTAAWFIDEAHSSGSDLHPAHYPWSHDGMYSSYDTASLRRGYEVYRNICATCHSMELIHFRDLVGVTHTEEQAKALAQSFTYMEGPNDKGDYVERKGRLADAFKNPYKNEEHARFGNNGAYPPDLSVIIKGRKGGADYIFNLLTGYKTPPAGVKIREGLHYNPYFPGGAISMAKALNDGGVEFEDGTPATESQMAKDVTSFLCWCAEPEADERKKLGVRTLFALSIAIVGAVYYKRFAWNLVKTKKITYPQPPSQSKGGDHH